MDKYEVGEVFTISDEDDQEQEVEVLATLTIENKDYIAVSFLEDLQQDNDQEDIDIFYLKVDQDGELSVIETDEEFDKVTTEFDKMIEEEQE